MQRINRQTEEHEPVALGIGLAVVQVALFFAFIGYCAFAPQGDPRDLAQGIPVHFVFGMLVICCGAVLTVVYVLVSNRREQHHD